MERASFSGEPMSRRSPAAHHPTRGGAIEPALPPYPRPEQRCTAGADPLYERAHPVGQPTQVGTSPYVAGTAAHVPRAGWRRGGIGVRYAVSGHYEWRLVGSTTFC